MNLTPRQQEIFDYIVWFLQENGIPPTTREIGEQFEIVSPNGVVSNLKALVRKGVIEHFPNVARGIRVLVRDTCPCCGTKISNQSRGDA